MVVTRPVIECSLVWERPRSTSDPGEKDSLRIAQSSIQDAAEKASKAAPKDSEKQSEITDAMKSSSERQS